MVVARSAAELEYSAHSQHREFWATATAVAVVPPVRHSQLPLLAVGSVAKQLLVNALVLVTPAQALVCYYLFLLQIQVADHHSRELLANGPAP